jgi:phage tail sheath protein FI
MLKEAVGNPAVNRIVAFLGNALDLLNKIIWPEFTDASATDKDPAEKKAIISNTFTLDGGSDGALPATSDYEGTEKTDTSEATGLNTFEAVPDISIVAAPGYTAYDRTQDDMLGIHLALIKHCADMRYRIAVLDTPERLTAIGALNFRNLTSSKYAAIYFPWVYISDPRPAKPGIPVTRLKVPPSGLVAGIYARNDIEHAVFKSPANEVVREALDFEQRLSKGHQEVLNPEGVNCFRFFEGRGMLLWGARTITDDPEWKYVSLRRYFAYLERSIDRGTQWAVFENNGPALWANVRRTIEDFLYNEWRNGGLLGEKPEKAYFVRCDRSTMTQNDLDNGRLVCLIGVSPVRPAEFVIFRIGQWTADSQS